MYEQTLHQAVEDIKGLWDLLIPLWPTVHREARRNQLLVYKVTFQKFPEMFAKLILTELIQKELICCLTVYRYTLVTFFFIENIRMFLPGESRRTVYGTREELQQTGPAG